MKTQATFLVLVIVLLCPVASAQWFPQESGTARSLYGITFIDAYTGTVVGDSGTILRTTNGGATWTSQHSGTMQQLYKVQFADANLGWAVGSSGTIVHTTNGGAGWVTQNSGTTAFLSGVSFTDAKTGWAVGESGIVLHTADGGANWTTLNTDSTSFLSDVHFFNADTGVAIGRKEYGYTYLLRTTDGGTSWDWSAPIPTDLQGIGNSRAPLAVMECHCLPHWNSICLQFTNNQMGSFAGVYNDCYVFSEHLLITSNGGATWSAVTSPPVQPTLSYFIDSSTGWVVGVLGDWAIWFTSDGGSTWLMQDTTGVLNEIVFVGQMNGWVVGDNGRILHTTNGGVASVDGEQKRAVPQQCWLCQNYPNPFNPKTTIGYTVGGTRRQASGVSEVRLSVYDILGREVAVLVNEKKAPGSYEVTFDASGLSSSVYFYRLEAGEFVQAKKLVVLR